MQTLPPCRFDFPDALEVDPRGRGLICIGGDLAPDTLINAYTKGLFPWYNEGEPIAWWSPDPRCVFIVDNYKPKKSLKRSSRKSPFLLTINQAFDDVISHCAYLRSDPNWLQKNSDKSHLNEGLSGENQASGTWIGSDMIAAYSHLHQLGVAHSIEVWQPINKKNNNQIGELSTGQITNATLVGGLYGLKLGGVFFGESMFHTQTDASKYAFWHLINTCKANGVALIDGQLSNPHLNSLGAIDIPRIDFLKQLSATLNKSLETKWRKGTDQPSVVSNLHPVDT